MIEDLLRLADDGSPLAHVDAHGGPFVDDPNEPGPLVVTILSAPVVPGADVPLFVPAWDGDYEDA